MNTPAPPSTIDHRSLYRLPWSFSDNVIAWLEPTSKCNLACEGCYRVNLDRHKSLAEVRADLDVFRRQRKFDGVSIAGGDPLLHPQIVEIVRMVARLGHKPVINTNGLALDETLLRQLREAGLVGVTFHVDSKQGRAGAWRGKDEIALNELRLHYARMVASVGGLSCAFNSTVYEDTLDQVPELVAWAQQHIDLVHVMVFIAFRAVVEDQFDYFRGGAPVDVSKLVYVDPARPQRTDISSSEVAARVQQRFPEFAPAAYLGGTEKPGSLKWLLATRVGTRAKIVGHVGPRFIEATQSLHHLITDRYFAYASPRTLRRGRSALLAGAAIDPGCRAALRSYARWVAGNPARALEPLHFQTIMFIQPVDILADGRQNMCDGCPDMTVHEGELVWSCRLEEKLRYGSFIHCVPRSQCSPPRSPRRPSLVQVLPAK